MNDTGSFHTYVPKGCELCQLGAKMVLFVSGICNRDCFYCPVSMERRRDVTFANERQVSSDMDLIEEAQLMDAMGTGITGGEPLLVPEKVLHYIRLLKSSFGEEHHIHLYTSIAPEKQLIEQLADAGLDEIRFHPPTHMWNRLGTSPYVAAIRYASLRGIETGIEIPAIEGVEDVIAFTNDMGCFLNLNELEFSDSNAEQMKLKGFVLESDISNAVEGSMGLARTSLSNCTGKVHFCSSTYKDAVQLRQRLIRVANNTARKFDDVTDEGTIVCGQVLCWDTHNMQLLTAMLQEQGLDAEMMEIKGLCLETAWWVLEDLADIVLKYAKEMTIVERYPFEDGFIVERIPL